MVGNKWLLTGIKGSLKGDQVLLGHVIVDRDSSERGSEHRWLVMAERSYVWFASGCGSCYLDTLLNLFHPSRMQDKISETSRGNFCFVNPYYQWSRLISICNMMWKVDIH